MDVHTGFRLPHICLPRPGIDLRKWAVIACDQYTSEPEYWQQVAREVGDAPSTLHLIFPEVYLGSADAPARIARIQATMRRYLAEGLLVERDGAVLRRAHGGGAHAPRPDAGARPRALRLQQRLDQPDPPHRRHDRRAPGAAHRGAARRRAGVAAHPGADRRPRAHGDRAAGGRARARCAAVRHRTDGRRRPCGRLRGGRRAQARTCSARPAGAGRSAGLRGALRRAGRYAADALRGRRRQPFAGHRQVDLAAAPGPRWAWITRAATRWSRW